MPLRQTHILFRDIFVAPRLINKRPNRQEPSSHLTVSRKQHTMSLKTHPPSVTTERQTSVRRFLLPLLLLILFFFAITTQFRLAMRAFNCTRNEHDPRVSVTVAATTMRSVTAETNDSKEQIRHFLTPASAWENSTVLPKWFKEYVILHRKQRLALNETNWKNQRFLIMRCLYFDAACEGASDRLSSIPSMLLLANATRRMLLIKWTRPAPLQEFLVPPKGGLDWTIPDWLDKHLDFRKLPEADGNHPGAIGKAESSAQIMTFRDQIHKKRAIFYNQRKGDNEPAFHIVYHDMWNTLFTPSPPVAALIRQNMNDLNLVPGKYVTAHVRSLYLSDERSDTDMIRNGINCATQLKPGWPIYVASDSLYVTRIALQYGRSKNSTIVARIADKETLHMDRGIEFLKASDNWKGRSPADFYGIFVDLYMMAGSQCLSYGLGGFGIWGAMLSNNALCVNAHQELQCHWTEPAPQNEALPS
jgi:hypothetical protein